MDHAGMNYENLCYRITNVDVQANSLINSPKPQAYI